MLGIGWDEISLGLFLRGSFSQIKSFDTADTSGESNSGFQGMGNFNFLIFIKFHFCYSQQEKS